MRGQRGLSGSEVGRPEPRTGKQPWRWQRCWGGWASQRRWVGLWWLLAWWLPSMGSHGVGHEWSDLAAAAAAGNSLIAVETQIQPEASDLLYFQLFSICNLIYYFYLIKILLNISLYHALPRAEKTIQFNLVAQSCPTLCDPMDCNTSGLPAHHQLPEFTQTCVHWVSDAIQPSHPLWSPPPTFNLSQHQCLFKWVSPLHQVPKISEFQFQHRSFQWTLRTDLLQDGLVGSPCSPRDSQEPSPTPQFKSINSSALSFLYSQTLTPIHDHWKNHSFH